MEKHDEADRIYPKNRAWNLPEVFMEISQTAGSDPKTAAAEIEGRMVKDFKHYKNLGEVDEPVKGILLTGQTGDRWDDTVVHYYILDNTKGGVFIIRQQYFVEASEGHGARFFNMLKEFKIVEPEKE
jgi:hypothetical protein